MYISLADALASGTGVERTFSCPVHDDANPSASVNVVKGLWVCYSCGASGKVDENYEVPDHIFTKEINRILDDRQRMVYPESWLKLYNATGPGEYWLSRYSPEACEHFGLGQTPEGDWATYPLRDESGSILGVVRRTLTGDKRKYVYPFGFEISEHLFNYHGCTKDTIVLTEGATDVFAAWEVGYDAMAVYGVNATPSQVRLIHRYAPTKIILAFDQDRAGNLLAEQWREALGDMYHITRPKWRKYKDLSEIPIAEREDSLLGRLDKQTRVRIVSTYGTDKRSRRSSQEAPRSQGQGGGGKGGSSRSPKITIRASHS